MRWLAVQCAGLVLVLCVACAATIAPQDNGGAQQTHDLDEKLQKRVEDLERAVSLQAVEILRLQLKLAKLENNDALQMEILQNGIVSPIVEVQVAAIREIGALIPEKIAKFIPSLRQVLSRKNGAAAQVQAVDVLSRYPEEEDLILQASRSESAEVRKACAVGLRGYATNKSFDALHAMVRDAAPSVQVAAIDGLGLSKHARAAEALLQISREPMEDEQLERVLQALGRKKIPQAFEVFKDQLTHKSENVRWACIHSLGELGDPRAVEFVKPFIAESHSKDIRMVAIRVLGQLKDQTSVAALNKLLRSDSDGHLRAAACQALGDMSAPEALEDLLVAMVTDREERVKQAAWDALQKISSQSIELEERMVRGLIERNRKPEIDFIMGRIRETRKPAEARPIQVVVADFLMAEKDFKVALDYWKALSADGEFGYDVKLAICYREVGDLDGSIKLLRDLLAKAKADTADWILAKVELARTLLRKDPKGCVDEVFPLLASPNLNSEARKTLEPIQEQAIKTLAQNLRTPEQKAAASEALKALHKKALGPILSMINRSEISEGLVEAANLITGTTFPPTIHENKEKLAEAIKAWTAFLNN